jgi:WD40 repeat protein
MKKTPLLAKVRLMMSAKLVFRTLLAIISVSNFALGATIDTRPRPSAVIPERNEVGFMTGRRAIDFYSSENWELLRSIETRGFIDEVSISPDGRYIVLGGGYSGGAEVYDISTGKQVTRIKIGSYVTDLSLSASGEYLSLCTEDGLIVICDLETGRQLKRFQASDEFLLSVAVTNDLRTVLFTDLSDQMFLLDVRSGDIEKMGIVAWHPVRYSYNEDFVCYVVAHDEEDGFGMTIKVLDVNDGFSVREIGSYVEIGGLKAIEGNRFQYVVGLDRRLGYSNIYEGRIYNPRDETEETVWSTKNWPTQGFRGSFKLTGIRDRSLAEIAFSERSDIGVLTTYDFVTTVCDLKTGEVIRSFDYSENYKYSGGVREYIAIMFYFFWIEIISALSLCILLAGVGVLMYIRYKGKKRLSEVASKDLP